MQELEQIKKELGQIKRRNARVEADKAWETSGARKVLVALLTYGVVLLFFYFAHLPKPFINAIVPTLGFMLSTLSVSVAKKFWIGIKNK